MNKDNVAVGKDEIETLQRRLDKLPPRKQRAVLRQMARTVGKAQRRNRPPEAQEGSYCCPKCHAWHATPEARLACRQSHGRQP